MRFADLYIYEDVILNLESIIWKIIFFVFHIDLSFMRISLFCKKKKSFTEFIWLVLLQPDLEFQENVWFASSGKWVTHDL